MPDDPDDNQLDGDQTDEETADEHADGDEAGDHGDTDRREPRTVPAGLFVVAVLVAGVFAVLAILAVSLGGDEGADESTARTTAGEYAERFLALSHDDYDAWLEDMRSIGTAGFAESVGRREGELRTLLTESQVSWQGSAVDVYLTREGDGLVSAVVLYDLEVTDEQGTRTIPDQYLRIDLVEAQEGWLIERVLSITSDASALVSGADRPPATAPPTTPTSTEPAG